MSKNVDTIGVSEVYYGKCIQVITKSCRSITSIRGWEETSREGKWLKHAD